MGKPTGFKEFDRATEPYREVTLRLEDYGEIFTGKHDTHAHLRIPCCSNDYPDEKCWGLC